VYNIIEQSNTTKHMAKLLDKLMKTTRVAGADILADSKFFSEKDLTSTPVGMVNVALSGSIDGGLASGLTVLAGPSKHFKTSFALLMAGAYLKKHKDAALIFYDSEFGSPQAYFESFDIDTSRVLHCPVTNIEELKFDLVNQLKEIERKDKVIVIIDSVGNIASKKEVEDAINEKSVADMTRAKALKGLFRMVTPFLTINDIPLLAINHTYQEQGLFPKQIVSGGTGVMYSADNVWIIGRRQDKKGTEVIGYDFVVNIEKSRFVKEKSKIPISVSWEGGIERWSGFTEIAIDMGYVIKPKNGWYMAINPETKEELSGNVRMKDTLQADFWKTILEKTDFATAIENKFKVAHRSLLGDDPVVSESGSAGDDSPTKK
jgi:RecA/RadA recombinase